MQAPASALPTAQGLSAVQALKPGPAFSALSRPLMRSLPNSQPPSRLSTPTLPASLIGGLQPTLPANSALQATAVAGLPGLLPQGATAVAVQPGVQQPQAPIGSATPATAAAGAVSVQQPLATLASGPQPDTALVPSGEAMRGANEAEAFGLSEPPGEDMAQVSLTTDGLETHKGQAPAVSDAVGAAQDGVAQLEGKFDEPAVSAPAPQLANGELKVPAMGRSEVPDKLPSTSAEAPAAGKLGVADKLPAASSEAPSASILQGVPDTANAPVAADNHDKASEEPVRSKAATAAAVHAPAELIKPDDALIGDLAPSQGASIVPEDLATALPGSSKGGDMGLTVIGRATANAASAPTVATSATLSEDILMADGFLAIDPPSPPKPGLGASHSLTGNAAQSSAEKSEANTPAGEEVLPAHDSAPLAIVDMPQPAAASVAAAASAEPLPSSSTLQLQAQPLQLSQSPITQPVPQNVQPLQPTAVSLGQSSAMGPSITAQPALQPLQPLQPFTVPGRPSSAGRGSHLAGLGRGRALQKGPSLLGLLRGIAPQTTGNPVPGTPLPALGTPHSQVGTVLTPHRPTPLQAR